MKKNLIYAFIAFLILCFFGICTISQVTADADEETVLVEKPYIWGSGGVDDVPVSTGLKWVWFSTTGVKFKIVPVKHQVDMDDLFSDDNTPLDFHTVIITQIKKGKSPILLKNYGVNWFETNIYNYYCNLVRDHISQHSPFDLMSNRAILNDIDSKILKQMQAYVNELSKEKEFPITIRQVTIGKAIPNQEQLQEMNKTAKAVQAKQTQERECEVQLAREKAERQRAKADKAYREELGLSTADFINLKWIETIAEKQGANIDVMVGNNTTPTTNMWNVRR